MGKAKLFTEQDILRAMAVTKSNLAAARYLNCNFWTYRTYAKLYSDPKTGITLFEKHKNQSGKGITRFGKNKGKTGDLQLILTGQIDNVDDYDIIRFKEALLRDVIFKEECNCCGFKEARVLDYKVPLLLNFKDRDRRNWKLENLEMLCYNCFYLTVGDVFTKKQIKNIESHVSSGQRESEVEWDLDPYMVEHLKSLGLMEDEPNPDDDYIAYKDYKK